MEHHLLTQFQALYEKQDVLSKLTDSALYDNMNYSEIHCLAAVGILDDPNVSKIAAHLHLTRGAISKIIKKLSHKELIEIFSKQGNKKEKYFRLTERGESINEQHTKAHDMWMQRDLQFLQDVSVSDQVVIAAFLERFNVYLEQLIEEKTS